VNEGRFSSAAQIDGFYRQLLERFHAVRGVVQASVSAPYVPLIGAGFPRRFTVVGSSNDSPSMRPSASIQMVTPEYFETFGIRILQGRGLTAHDGPGAQRVAVVNERFVKLFLEARDPLLQRVTMSQFVPRTANLSFGSGAPGSAVEWHIVGVF